MVDLKLIFKANRRDVALVLSSGGARGLAHIGAIDALTARGYRITSVAGTSMGAVVGAMYAAGCLEPFKQWLASLTSQDRRRLTDYAFSLSYMVKGVRIIDALKQIAPDRDIRSLRIPFTAIATNWNTGCEVVFDRGSMWEAVRASISVPGYLEPVTLGDKMLIDGGITNPLPLDRVGRNGRDLLVGVNVSGHDYAGIYQRKKSIAEWKARNPGKLALLRRLLPDGFEPRLNYYTLLEQTISIAISQNARRQILLNRPDILVDLPMKRYGGNDYDKYEQIRHAGERKMLAAIDRFVRTHDTPAPFKRLTRE